MRLGRGLVVVVASFAAIGGGQALMGDGMRALAWLGGATAIGLLATLTSPWLYLAIAIPLVGSALDAWLRVQRAERPLHVLTQWPIAVLMANIGIVMLAMRFLVGGVYVTSNLMAPTYEEGDSVLFERLSPLWRAPQRGELVAIADPCSRWNTPEIRRVIAVGGDTIEIRCQVVYVNGKALATERVAGDCHWAAHERCGRYREMVDGRTYDVLGDRDPTPSEFDFPRYTVPPSCRDYDARRIAEPIAGDGCAPRAPFAVPQGEVFVLDDVRDSSSDSRTWGSVSTRAVIGRPTMTIWSKR